jgi:hypothetical protein
VDNIVKKKRHISKKAVLASIHSSRTPKNLKKGLKKYAEKKGWL